MVEHLPVHGSTSAGQPMCGTRHVHSIGASAIALPAAIVRVAFTEERSNRSGKST